MHPLKLKIELQHAPVKIIRKVLIPDNLNMWQVHLVIQYAMGWQNAHLFEFKNKMYEPDLAVYIDDGEEYGMGMMHQPEILRSPDKGGLRELFVEKNESKAFWYWYDFGDDWMHKISFLKVSKKDLAQFNGIPLCIDAKGTCPPEDIGGVWGYAHFIEVVGDNKHPHSAEFRDWTILKPGEPFDPTNVDIEEINTRLDIVLNDKQWNDCPKDIS